MILRRIFYWKRDWMTNLPPLTDIRVHDGSRNFLSLPQSQLWHRVRDHVAALDGAELTGFLCDGVTEAWIEFTFREWKFSINDQLGEYWFFVNDPQCPDAVLQLVGRHFAAFLD